jgi:hypothetical protein
VAFHGVSQILGPAQGERAQVLGQETVEERPDHFPEKGRNTAGRLWTEIHLAHGEHHGDPPIAVQPGAELSETEAVLARRARTLLDDTSHQIEKDPVRMDEDVAARVGLVSGAAQGRVEETETEPFRRGAPGSGHLVPDGGRTAGPFEERVLHSQGL